MATATVQQIRKAMLELAVEPKRAQMEKYMKNKFKYLGVPQPQRNQVFKQFFDREYAKKLEKIDEKLVEQLYGQEEREFQYLAIDYLAKFENLMEVKHLQFMLDLAGAKQHWDSIDLLSARCIGPLCRRHREAAEQLVLPLKDHQNFWMRRVSILFMLLWASDTNEEWLTAVLTSNFGSSEFFINKAIGWALRQYSKTNPGFVRAFIAQHGERMSALSVKEASKFL